LGADFFYEEHFIHAGRLHELILEKTQCECITGCSGMGVISTEEEITNGPGLVLMAGYTPGNTSPRISKISGTRVQRWSYSTVE